MYIKKIKYNQELIKNKIRLEKELNMINQELDETESSCDHIQVIIGYIGKDTISQGTPIKKCLLCGMDINFPYFISTKIDASTYKEEIYGDGWSKEKREGRLNEVRNLWIKQATENSKLCESELIAKVQEEINEEEKIKKLGHKTI